MPLGPRSGRGITAPQDLLGVLQMLKEGALRPSNVAGARLGPGGTVEYPAAIDTPAAAMGRFVQLGPGVGQDPDVLKHERRHTAQSSALGLGYLPAAAKEFLGTYGAGPLERDAMRHTTPNAEMLREGSSMYVKPSDPAKEEYLRGLLGE